MVKYIVMALNRDDSGWSRSCGISVVWKELLIESSLKYTFEMHAWLST